MEKSKAWIEVLKVVDGVPFDLDWQDVVVAAEPVKGGIYVEESDTYVDGTRLTIVRR